jgi:Na+/glutamate symporter
MRVNTGDREQKIRMGIGAAAAAAAIFAPLGYKWKGVLSGVATLGLITGVTGYSPFKHALRVGRELR